MFVYLVAGLLILLLLLWFLAWAIKQPPAAIANFLRVLLWTLLLIPVIYLKFRLFHPVVALVLAFLLVTAVVAFTRSRKAPPAAISGASGGLGQTSSVETDVLRMQLDHATGRMEGEVRTGPYAGSSLDDLDLSELQEIWDYCTQFDPSSLTILENYLDRERSAAWRQAFGLDEADKQEQQEGTEKAAGQGQGKEEMSAEEAYSILGLAPGAEKKEIQEAYRRLMRHMHPDHGGSDYLASKINQARKRLLAD